MAYWHECMRSRRVIGHDPKIEWQSNPHARTSGELTELDYSLRRMARLGSWNFFSYFMDWVLFGFGTEDTRFSPKEPSGAEGASDRLTRCSTSKPFWPTLTYYLGIFCRENQHGAAVGVFPTRLSVVEMLVLMTVDVMPASRRSATPASGQVRMLMVARNYSRKIVMCGT